jgi:hypothetical protein
MFNVEKAISAWRQQVSHFGLTDRAVLDELESHLRDEIDRQLIKGLTPEQAFQIAVQQIGSAVLIKEEFNKTNAMKQSRKQTEKIIGAIGFGVYALTSMYGLLFANHIAASLNERLLGLTAVVITGLLLVVSVDAWRVVPVITAKKVRLSVALGCAIFGAIVTWIVFHVVMPKFDLTLAQIVVTTLWALVPLVIGGAIAGGILEAAERRTTSAT